MSDELEFEIDDEVNHVESLYFDTDLNHNRRRQLINNGGGGILDLDDDDDDNISRTNADEQPNNGAKLKRGSTQATAAENNGNNGNGNEAFGNKKNSSEQQDPKFQSPSMMPDTVQKEFSGGSPRESTNARVFSSHKKQRASATAKAGVQKK